MFHPLQLLAQLPKIRTGLLLACLLAGCADLITSIVLLAYQLALTVSVVPPFIERAILAETHSRHSLSILRCRLDSTALYLRSSSLRSSRR